MTMIGPDFISLQVRDLHRAAEFYESRLGFTRAESSPPGAVVFASRPASFAVREPLPGVNLDAVSPQPGVGVALWFGATEAQKLHDQLAAAGVTIAVAPFDGPFGFTFTLIDPDGYAITVHEA